MGAGGREKAERLREEIKKTVVREGEGVNERGK